MLSLSQTQEATNSDYERGVLFLRLMVTHQRRVTVQNPGSVEYIAFPQEVQKPRWFPVDFCGGAAASKQVVDARI